MSAHGRSEALLPERAARRVVSADADLFSPLRLRGVALRNRIVVGPMMQYATPRGVAGRWHLVHLASRAMGGAGTVFVEQTAVTPEGRSTLDDLGLWNDEQQAALAPIAAAIADAGAMPAIQLGHSGRKGSIRAPWGPRTALTREEGAWTPLAPSAIALTADRPPPRELTAAQIEETIAAFAQAAHRAREAGFKLVEVHGAHGYLPHQFLSPLSNHRGDAYGGSFENRSRFLLEVVAAIRAALGDKLALAVRLSADDGVPNGWTFADTLALVPLLHEAGVDLIDLSSGGLLPTGTMPQNDAALPPLAHELKQQAGLAVGVGWHITDPQRADAIVRQGDADLVFVARQALRDPYWAYRAAHVLGREVAWPVQYERGRW